MPIGRCWGTTCCFSQRQVQRLPVPLGESEETCIFTCAKQTCSATTTLRSIPAPCPCLHQSVLCKHTVGLALPTAKIYSHLGCTSVCSTAHLPARHVQRKLLHCCSCCFPSLLPGKDVRQSFMGVGSGTRCCAHPRAQLLSWQCQDSPWGSLPNTTRPRALTHSQITASKKQK